MGGALPELGNTGPRGFDGSERRLERLRQTKPQAGVLRLEMQPPRARRFPLSPDKGGVGLQHLSNTTRNNSPIY